VVVAAGLLQVGKNILKTADMERFVFIHRAKRTLVVCTADRRLYYKAVALAGGL
jgi:hypothetical protein